MELRRAGIDAKVNHTDAIQQHVLTSEENEMLREIEPDEILSFQDPRSPQLLLSIDLSTSFTVENASLTGWQKQHQSTVLSITTILWGVLPSNGIG